MELLIREETFEFMNTVYSDTLTTEGETEKVVPDAMADVTEIVYTDGVILLRSKEALSGRVTIAGTAEISVACRTEKGNIGCMRFEVPVSASGEAPGITTDSAIVAEMSLTACEVRLTNPRKLQIKVSASAVVTCYEHIELKIPSGVYDAEQAELLTNTDDVTAVASAFEKTFVIGDEFKLPGIKPDIGEVLSASVQINTDETKSVGTKLIVRGTIFSSVIYNPADGGETDNVEFSVPFSQIIDTEFQTEELIFEVKTALTGAFLSQVGSNRSITYEVHAVAQCIAYTKRSITYLSDIFSTRYELQTEMKTAVISGVSGFEETTGSLRGKIETPFQVKNVITSWARCNKSRLDYSNDSPTLSASLAVTVLFLDNSGNLHSVSQSFEVEAALPEGPGTTAVIASTSPKDVYASVAEQGIDVRAQLYFSVKRRLSTQLPMVHNVSYNEEIKIDYSGTPSLIMHRTLAGETLWELSKRCRSSVGLIISANDLEAVNEVEEGTMLIIPKKR